MPQHTREGAYDHRPEMPRFSWSGSWLGGVIAFAMLLATLGATYAIYAREKTLAAEAAGGGAQTARTALAGAPTSGEFRVPEPGDPEYADYREMLAQPMFRSSLENTPGYAPPYDPEWRSVQAGRREVAPTNLEFVNGAGSLEDLGRFVALAAMDGDGQALLSLAVNQPEFETILWPEFPQSRPYLRIPPAEGWNFHYADLTKGISRGGLALFGKPYTFVGLRAGSVREYSNFRFLEDIVLTCRDENTGEIEEFDFIGIVAERNGRFKVYEYSE